MLIKDIKNIVAGLKSIEVANEEIWAGLDRSIQGIMIVGSTCSGKSTTVDVIRKLSKTVIVPKRVITRPQRLNDNLLENIFSSKDQFTKMIRNNEIGLHWTRKMEGSREEQYGFESVPPDKFVVYSGNNALYNNKESVKPKETFSKHIYVGIYAPDEVRKQRLLSRSPDMDQAELEYRLGDKSENILKHCHVIVKNFGSHEKSSASDLLKLIKYLQKA